MVTLKFGGNFIFGNIELLMHFITISTIRWLDYHTNKAQLLVEYLTLGFLFYIYQNKNTPSKDTKYASFAWMRFNTPGENSFMPLDINSVGTSEQNNDKVLYIDTYNTQCKKWTITFFGFKQIFWILWQKKRYFPKELLKVEMWKAVVLKRSSFYVSGLRPFWRDCWRLVNKVFYSTLLGLKLWIHLKSWT